MRTVVAGTISQALLDTQQDAIRTPYIKIYLIATTWVVNTAYIVGNRVSPITPNNHNYKCTVAGTSHATTPPAWPTTPGATVTDGTVTWTECGLVDLSSRLMYIEHAEEAYRERAVIGISNRDGVLDTASYGGMVFNVGYGYDSSGNGGSATDKVDTAPLWVKSYQIITLGGERIYQLYAEGAWMRLREQKVITGVTGAQAGDATHDPYGNTFNATDTVYELLEHVIEGAMSWDLVATPPDDGIITTLSPIFEVNQLPYENAAALIYRLMWMTKEYLRLEASSTATTPRFRCIYPQSADATDETYQSDKANCTGDMLTFDEYTEKVSLLIPNSIVVLANRDADDGWSAMIVGTANAGTEELQYYGELIQVYIDGSLATQGNADLRAQAILIRLKGETLAGRLIIPHDARVELYDKPDIVDTRTGTTRTWPTDGMVRISNIIHRYDKNNGIYQIEAALGEVSADFGVPEFHGTAKPLSPIEVKETPAVVPSEPDFHDPYDPFPGPAPSPTVTTPPKDWRDLFTPAPQPKITIPTDIVTGPQPPPKGPSLWSRITPWKEEAGETFPSEVKERIDIIVPILKAGWQAITPWKEEKGETFGSEVMERIDVVKKFLGGLFGGK